MKRLLQSFAVVGVLLSAVSVAYSCGCMRMSFEEKFAATGYVFVGTVIDISEDTKLKRMPHDSRRYFVRMKVLENFKGAPGKEIVLSQYEIKRHNTSCPYFPLELNETYLIYASATSYPTWGSKIVRDIQHQTACAPTQKFDASSPTYAALRDLKAKVEKKKSSVSAKRKKS